MTTYRVITQKIELAALKTTLYEGDILPEMEDSSIEFLLKHDCIEVVPDVISGKQYKQGDLPKKKWGR